MNDAEDSVDEPSTRLRQHLPSPFQAREQTPFLCLRSRVRDFSSIRALLRGFRIWVTGRPVFWRKGHVPEYWIGQHELHTHLRMTALMPVNVCDNTLQSGFCLDVRQSEPLSSVHLCRHQDQTTMGTDSPRVRLFFKRQSNTVLPGDSDGDGHQYSLTPSAVCREPGGFAGFRKPRFKSPKLLRLNSGKHQPHALASAGVNDSCPGFKQLCPLCDAYVCERP